MIVIHKIFATSNRRDDDHFFLLPGAIKKGKVKEMRITYLTLKFLDTAIFNPPEAFKLAFNLATLRMIR